MKLEEAIADIRFRADQLPRYSGARINDREFIAGAEESLRRAHFLAAHAEEGLQPRTSRPGAIRV